MPYQGYPDGLYLVKRKSLTKGVDHYGILDIGGRVGGGHHSYPGSEPMVAHQVDTGLQYDAFIGTGIWVVLHKVPDEALALQRMREAAKNPAYDLFGNNCEHFARFVATGTRESTQLQFATALLVLVVGVIAIAAGE
jgi:hypothetical protein